VRCSGTPSHAHDTHQRQRPPVEKGGQNLPPAPSVHHKDPNRVPRSPPPPPGPVVTDEVEECLPGWAGADCDRCAAGHSGGQCAKNTVPKDPMRKPRPTPGESAVVDEVEECLPGWAGADCDRCAPGHSGEHCTKNARRVHDPKRKPRPITRRLNHA
jgi:hypothetical protein